MVFKLTLAALLAVFATGSLAGVKEDFVDGVMKSCGKSKEEAEKMATPGRTGNVVKWQMCKSGTVDIDGCALTCVDASSKIGG